MGILALLAALALGVPAVAPQLPLDPPGLSGSLLGAHLHSRFLAPASPVNAAELAAWAREDGLQMVAVGVPLTGPGGPATGLASLATWLDAAQGLPTIPEFNTFTLPATRQDAAGLRQVFAVIDSALQGRSGVVAAVGGNEPLSAARGWKSPAEAAARVALEHQLWHALGSDVPFCHKFTNPRIDPAGTTWADLDALWTDHQDAICYDWYASNGDTLATLDHLRDLGDQLGKPVYILEAAVPLNQPSLRDAMASRVDALLLYPWLAPDRGEDARLAMWSLGTDGSRAPGPAAALRPVARPA